MPRLPLGASSKLWGVPETPCPVCNRCSFPICGPARRHGGTLPQYKECWVHYASAECDSLAWLADLEIMDAMEHDMGIP